jgi:hypothetical protein
LFDLKHKVSEIMETVRSPFNDFDFVVNSFQPGRVNRIYSMVDEPIGITQELFSKLRKLLITGSPGLTYPGLQGRTYFFLGAVLPQHFKFILQNIDGIKHLIDRKNQIKFGVTAKRSKFVYLALSGESKSDGKLAQNLVFAVTPSFNSLQKRRGQSPVLSNGVYYQSHRP